MRTTNQVCMCSRDHIPTPAGAICKCYIIRYTLGHPCQSFDMFAKYVWDTLYS